MQRFSLEEPTYIHHWTAEHPTQMIQPHLLEEFLHLGYLVGRILPELRRWLGFCGCGMHPVKQKIC